MKIKYILIGILSLLTFSTYAQSEKIESKGAVTEFKVKTANLDELKNFNWNIVKEMFQDNKPEQEITLVFTYVNNSEIDKSKVKVGNFEMKAVGKTVDLDKLTARLKRSFEKFEEIYSRTIKN
jgi:hypothetical protein